MILDDKEIEQLARKGVKITDSNGQPIKPKYPISKPDEVDYLRIIAGLLERILAKPDPKLPAIRPPDVIVKPPEVTVNAPTIPSPPPRIKKWKFALKKDFNGYTTEITATAIE